MKFSDLLKIFDLKPRFFFAIGLIGALTLFLPQQIKDTLGITQLVDTYRSIVGTVTLISFVLWIVQLQPWKLILGLIEKRNFKKEFVNKLADLSDNERILLAYCVSRRKQTIHLNMMHAVATALRAKGFLGYVEGGVYVTSMPFSIYPHVWKELINHKFDLFSKEDWENPKMEDVFKNIDQQMVENERKTYR
jgi:hypothetical protein